MSCIMQDKVFDLIVPVSFPRSGDNNSSYLKELLLGLSICEALRTLAGTCKHVSIC